MEEFNYVTLGMSYRIKMEMDALEESMANIHKNLTGWADEDNSDMPHYLYSGLDEKELEEIIEAMMEARKMLLRLEQASRGVKGLVDFSPV